MVNFQEAEIDVIKEEPLDTLVPSILYVNKATQTDDFLPDISEFVYKHMRDMGSQIIEKHLQHKIDVNKLATLEKENIVLKERLLKWSNILQSYDLNGGIPNGQFCTTRRKYSTDMSSMEFCSEYRKYMAEAYPEYQKCFSEAIIEDKMNIANNNSKDSANNISKDSANNNSKVSANNNSKDSANNNSKELDNVKMFTTEWRPENKDECVAKDQLVDLNRTKTPFLSHYEQSYSTYPGNIHPMMGHVPRPYTYPQTFHNFQQYRSYFNRNYHFSSELDSFNNMINPFHQYNYQAHLLTPPLSPMTSPVGSISYNPPPPLLTSSTRNINYNPPPTPMTSSTRSVNYNPPPTPFTSSTRSINCNNSVQQSSHDDSNSHCESVDSRELCYQRITMAPMQTRHYRPQNYQYSPY